MVTRLAPFLGVRLSPGPDAYEQLRHLPQAAAAPARATLAHQGSAIWICLVAVRVLRAVPM